MDNKGAGTEAQQHVWGGAIPLQIHLHESEVTTLPPPPPALVTPSPSNCAVFGFDHILNWYNNSEILIYALFVLFPPLLLLRVFFVLGVLRARLAVF